MYNLILLYSISVKDMADNTCTILLVGLVVLLFCYEMSKRRKVVVIEPEFENFDATTVNNKLGLDLKTVQISNCGNSNPNCQNKYFIQGDRYSELNKQAQSCYCGDFCSCSSEKSQWSTPYTPGANGSVEDLRWQFMSPKMTLVDNSLNYTPSQNYYGPAGFDTDSGRFGEISSGQLGQINGIPESYKSADQVVDISKQIMFQPLGTGIRQHEVDELTRVIEGK